MKFHGCGEGDLRTMSLLMKEATSAHAARNRRHDNYTRREHATALAAACTESSLERQSVACR